MNTADKDIINLLNRKQAYLDRCENPKAKQAISIEIKIIKSYIDDCRQIKATKHQEISDLQGLLKQKVINIELLEAICLLHGISDINGQLAKGNKYIIEELKNYKKNNIAKVPADLLKYVESLEK
jgi:hypothetical protein